MWADRQAATRANLTGVASAHGKSHLAQAALFGRKPAYANAAVEAPATLASYAATGDAVSAYLEQKLKAGEISGALANALAGRYGLDLKSLAREELARQYGGALSQFFGAERGGKSSGSTGSASDNASNTGAAGHAKGHLWARILKVVGTRVATDLLESPLLTVALPQLLQDEEFMRQASDTLTSCDKMGQAFRDFALSLLKTYSAKDLRTPEPDTGLTPGDVIYVKLNKAQRVSEGITIHIPIEHHGIYLGRGFTMEVTNLEDASGQHRVNLGHLAVWAEIQNFVDGRLDRAMMALGEKNQLKTFTLYRRDFQDKDRAYTIDQRMRTIETFIGFLGCHNYHLFLNNCESAVTYARTGRFVSAQASRVVERVLRYSAVGMMAASLAALGLTHGTRGAGLAGRVKQAWERVFGSRGPLRAWERLVGAANQRRKELLERGPASANTASAVRLMLGRQAKFEELTRAQLLRFVEAVVTARLLEPAAPHYA